MELPSTFDTDTSSSKEEYNRENPLITLKQIFVPILSLYNLMDYTPPLSHGNLMLFVDTTQLTTEVLLIPIEMTSSNPTSVNKSSNY